MKILLDVAPPETGQSYRLKYTRLLQITAIMLFFFLPPSFYTGGLQIILISLNTMKCLHFIYKLRGYKMKTEKETLDKIKLQLKNFNRIYRAPRIRKDRITLEFHPYFSHRPKQKGYYNE